MKKLIKKIKVSDLSLNLNIGDYLETTILPDYSTTLHNVQKITDIESDGTIRIECIDPKCKKEGCTYLNLLEIELKYVKINNTAKKSQRLSGMTM